MPLKMNINETRRYEYRKKGYWGNATLEDYWNMTVLSMPDKIAVRDHQQKCYTYVELDQAANKVAGFLEKAGVVPGDFVSFQIPGWAEFTLIYIACLKAGAVANPILPSYRSNEWVYILNKCETKVLFCPVEYRGFDYRTMLKSVRSSVPSLRQIVLVEKEKAVYEGNTINKILKSSASFGKKRKVNADDLAAVLFTSGTEGLPKGVMFTHNTIIASERAYAATMNLTCYDKILMPAPVAHATGFHHGVTAAFMLGATSVLQDKFNVATSLELIAREKCTCTMGPTPLVYDMIQILHKVKYDISSLRFVLCGGAPVPHYIVKEASRLGINVVDVYGSTESTPHAATRLDDFVSGTGIVNGCAVPGVEIGVVDNHKRKVSAGIEGEEISRGPNVFVGYLKNPILTAKVMDENGWYYSGDLCIMDENGAIRITGRKKDVIIRGGENISSVEVEAILIEHPEIRDVSVVSMPDDRLGEKACAYVVLEKGIQGLGLEEIRAFFSNRNVAKYKTPERIEIVNCLPRTPTGKVKKGLLREDIRRKLRQESKEIKSVYRISS
jgi:acyl-CoA synthetase